MGTLVKFVVMAFVFAGAVQSQQLTNADIIKMLGAGLGEAIVIQTVEAAGQVSFDTTPDGLIALKKAGATDGLLQKMIARQSKTEVTPKPPVPIAANGACQLEAPGSGGLVIRASGSLHELAYKTANVDSNLGGLVSNAFSFGIAKVRSKTVLRIDRDRATVRMTDRQPELVDVLYNVGGSPENIYVVKLTVKDGARFIQVGTTEANLIGSRSSSWVMPEGTRVEMSARTLAGKCSWQGKDYSHHRMQPARPLQPGEYALISGAPDGRGIIMFDFGVD